MADEQDRWLDRETAEFLLRGEPLEGLESADPVARDRAERLVVALGALSPLPTPSDEELPGEAAALAAFRKVHAERADASSQARAALGRGAAPGLRDTAVVRIGPRGEGARRARWSRPLRLGLAAALTVGMVGGVAVAAGTGVLPTPFDRTQPEPAATASAATSPGRSPAPPSPLDGVQGGKGPGAGPDASDGGAARDGDGTADRDPDGREAGGPDGNRSRLTASCRKVRAGKPLDAARRRALTEAAGGASRVVKYCGGLLAAVGNGTGGRDAGEHGDSGKSVHEGGHGNGGQGDGNGKGDDKNGKNGKSVKSDKSDKDKGDKGTGDGKDDKNGKGGKDGNGKKGDDGDDDGSDDDADHATPPERGPHRPHRPHHAPHAPAADGPRSHRAPHAAHAPHATPSVKPA
ncbi:hypothetical protein [Streptomyces sp. NPDC048187]|uniref:hypothetical protein n=1 Tax=Streptomyces sp. NPDC048187 TaxID=3365509 RepID=UPI0037177781